MSHLTCEHRFNGPLPGTVLVCACGETLPLGGAVLCDSSERGAINFFTATAWPNRDGRLYRMSRPLAAFLAQHADCAALVRPSREYVTDRGVRVVDRRGPR